MKKQRGQPKKEIKRDAVKLTILPSVRKDGDKLAFQQNKSLSRYVEDLIRADKDRFDALKRKWKKVA